MAGGVLWQVQGPIQMCWGLAQVCQSSHADGSVQAVEVYVQLSPDFSLSDLRLQVGRNHVEVIEKVGVA